ncbi:MAG TPA: spore germination protein, partial [Bacillota bacterium]|nr:spore germination protein [Bacillota bacterium]
ILREAGIRLPRPIGQAVSIVGALVIGQTAVSAGLIGAPMVIVVALTAITSFVNPHFSEMSAYLRVGFTILAGFSGGFGLLMGLLVTFTHMAALRSFGVPYLAPTAPFEIRGQKDILIRAPWWTMFTRPQEISKGDPKRQEFRLMPKPPSKEKE